jgi:hypothetical protein
MMLSSHEDPKRVSDKVIRWASIVIGLCALSFQIFVLYPWHLEISEQIVALTKLVKS